MRVAQIKGCEVDLQEHYYTRLAGKVEGPFSLAELAERASHNKFSTIHEVSEDRKTWTPADELMSQLDVPRPRPRKRRAPVDAEFLLEPADEPDLLGPSPQSPTSQPGQPETRPGQIEQGFTIQI